MGRAKEALLEEMDKTTCAFCEDEEELEAGECDICGEKMQLCPDHNGHRLCDYHEHVLGKDD